MSTELRIVEKPEKLNAQNVCVGDMWRYPEHDVPGREAWYVCLAHSDLPHPILWYTTQRDSNENKLWDVTGTPPRITVTPSINAEPYWHGHITNGVMTP